MTCWSKCRPLNRSQSAVVPRHYGRGARVPTSLHQNPFPQFGNIRRVLAPLGSSWAADDDEQRCKSSLTVNILLGDARETYDRLLSVGTVVDRRAFGGIFTLASELTVAC